MPNASRTQSASVVEELSCKKCGWPLVKKGNLKCARCGQETPAVLALEKEDFRCPHCLEQEHRKAKCLTKANQIKCPKCGELNLLKEGEMTTEKVSQILNMIKGLPEEAKNELLKQIASLNIEPTRPVSESELREKMLEFLEKILNLSVAGTIEWTKKLVKHNVGFRCARDFAHYSATINNITIVVISDTNKTGENLGWDAEIIVSYGDQGEKISFKLEKLLKKQKKWGGLIFNKRARIIIKIYRRLLKAAKEQVDLPEIRKSKDEQTKKRGKLFKKIDETIKSF